VGGQGTGDGSPRLASVAQRTELPAALDTLGVPRPRPVLLMVGGAGGMDEAARETLAGVLRDAVLPSVERHGAVVVDGGTDSGVMRMLGRARAAGGGGFPLVGVAATGTVRVPGGGPVIDDAAELERNHSHAVLVPGNAWGDESPWLAAVAEAIAGGCPWVTVVVNGGEITYADAAGSVDRGRPLVGFPVYGDAARNLEEAKVDWEDVDPETVPEREVERVEDVFRSERAQWGQLVVKSAAPAPPTVPAVKEPPAAG
jgi:SLOG in TRPM, prokaryote